MRDILRKQPVLLAIGLLALGSVLAVVDAPWASEDATSAGDSAANGENEIDVTAAESGEEIQASTPADEMDTRVRSIRRNEYFYQSYGRKDLFAALVTGDFEPIQGGEIVDVNSATLVGVIWGAADRFALVEDGSGNGYILRVGDRVANGRVTAIQKDSLVAAISLYGITSRVILRLENREGDQ